MLLHLRVLKPQTKSQAKQASLYKASILDLVRLWPQGMTLLQEICNSKGTCEAAFASVDAMRHMHGVTMLHPCSSCYTAGHV